MNMRPSLSILCMKQGCQFLAQGVSDWSQIGKIWDFLRSVSIHFGSASQNVQKLILKSPRFVSFGPNLTQLWSQIWHPCCEMTQLCFVWVTSSEWMVVSKVWVFIIKKSVPFTYHNTINTDKSCLSISTIMRINHQGPL